METLPTSPFSPSILRIINDAASILSENIPHTWEGQDAIMYMKRNGCTNWRQMEWPGWYFQFMCERLLPTVGFQIPGPGYGNVEFDGLREIPWDFKAHADQGGTQEIVPGNGYEEVIQAINQYGKVGFIVARGKADYDTSGDFKRWHDEQKGETSQYELERITRGAPSRQRKVQFHWNSLNYVIIDRVSINYCGHFQQGMRNSNGVPRNSKISINLNSPSLIPYIHQARIIG